MTYAYLASPYTHPDPAIREQRYHAACHAAAALMKRGECVLSPIAHSHPIEVIGIGRQMNGQFWKRQDIPLIRHAGRVVVLCLEGWEESAGIAWEIELAHSLHIPVTFLLPDTMEEFQG